MNKFYFSFFFLLYVDVFALKFSDFFNFSVFSDKKNVELVYKLDENSKIASGITHEVPWKLQAFYSHRMPFTNWESAWSNAKNRFQHDGKKYIKGFVILCFGGFFYEKRELFTEYTKNYIENFWLIENMSAYLGIKKKALPDSQKKQEITLEQLNEQLVKMLEETSATKNEVSSMKDEMSEMKEIIKNLTTKNTEIIN